MVVPYSLDMSLRLACDASLVWAVAVTVHMEPDGTDTTVVCWLKTFSKAEQGYFKLYKVA
jgi:hypothetical protein